MSDIFHPCQPAMSVAAARQTSDVPAIDPEMHRSMIRINCDADYQAKHFDPGHRRISVLQCLQAADACAQAEAVRA